MDDYLKQYCTTANLELVYTNNKFTLLSCGTENNLPTIRAHKIFKNCGKELANAIIKYYTDFRNKDIYLEIIEVYLKKHYPSKQYKIKAPTKAFNQLLINKTPVSHKDRKSKDSMVEVNVISITQKRFSGTSSNSSPGEPLRGLSEDPLELEIVVVPFDT